MHGPTTTGEIQVQNFLRRAAKIVTRLKILRYSSRTAILKKVKIVNVTELSEIKITYIFSAKDLSEN